jgi:spermidine synthase
METKQLVKLWNSEMRDKRINKRMILVIIYICFFFSGFTSLVFEILWSRQFVTVFGNSSYAISIVLCAYMAGLGLGGIFGGKIADSTKKRAEIYVLILTTVAIWAILIPPMLDWLRSFVPGLSSLLPNSLLLSIITRFGLSFIVLVIPCFLMGTTLPLLVRMVTESADYIGVRIGMLYALNTLGAAFGSFTAGIWMVDTLGLGNTNLVGISINIAIAVVILVFLKPINLFSTVELSAEDSNIFLAPEHYVPLGLLLSIAFFNGVVGLASEVLWLRYLSFLASVAYVFPLLLSIYLLGIAVGGLIYRLFATKMKRPLRTLGLLEIMLALSIPAAFVISAFIFAKGPPEPIGLKGMAFITMFVPTILMGIIFPLLCSIYGNKLEKLGRSIGKLYAVNTIGTVAGSLLPVFFLVPLFGIQLSLFIISIIAGAIGLSLLAYNTWNNKRFIFTFAVVYALFLIMFFVVVPRDLCQEVFLSTDFELNKHNDILFYKEGRTGTAIVTRDRINNCKTVYINGMREVPVLYAHKLCFKMIGCLGPLLHPKPDEVLMICFGGGIAAGATTCFPEVKSLTIVDLEESVVEAAKLLSEENNHLLENPSVKVVIEDGRNYLLISRRKWPVIVSDATHPKSGDSWVLYTREFYRLVQEHLTDDGVFVQWLPMHSLSTAEFKIILRTFLSVFPNVSLWITHGVDERATFSSYTLLTATAKPLEIDVSSLRERLNAEMVHKNLEPYGLHTPLGFLNTFLCAEDRLQLWVGKGPVNTDNLPYSYYETQYSKGSRLIAGELTELMEDVWPFLSNIGSDRETQKLKEELTRYTEVNRLALLGHIGEAYALFPDDIRCIKMRGIYETWPTYLKRLVNMYWEDSPVLMMLAQKMLKAPRGIQPAVNIYERVLELEPNNIEALNSLSSILINEGHLKLAEEYLERAVNLKPNDAESHYNLSLVLERSGRRKEAFQHLRKAAMNASFEEAPRQLGLYFARKKLFSEAIPWFRKAVEINPISTQSRIYLAVALLSTRQIQEALQEVNYVLKIEPENEIALEILAEIGKEGETVIEYQVDTIKP